MRETVCDVHVYMVDDGRGGGGDAGGSRDHLT